MAAFAPTAAEGKRQQVISLHMIPIPRRSTFHAVFVYTLTRLTDVLPVDTNNGNIQHHGHVASSSTDDVASAALIHRIIQDEIAQGIQSTCQGHHKANVRST